MRRRSQDEIEVRPQTVLAGDFLGEGSQIGWTKTSPGPKPLGEEWNGRDGRRSRKEPPRLPEDVRIEWLEFDLFQEVPNLIHGLFLRHGGVSDPPYDTLNLGYDIGDVKRAVATNLERVQRTLDIDRLVYAKQVHGTHLVEVERSDQFEHPECDGFYTAQPGVGLMVKHADCQAALFYDPLERVIAAVHCGWRGSVQNIYAHTVRVLKTRYGSRPEELLVGISPSLGPEGAEFQNYREELPEPFWEFQTTPNYFDFWEISRRQLLEAGLLPGHIEIAKICTYSEPKDWFSYRRDGLTGRHGSLIAIR